MLQFNISKHKGYKKSQTKVLDFKKTDFNKPRENMESIPRMKILKGKTT